MICIVSIKMIRNVTTDYTLTLNSVPHILHTANVKCKIMIVFFKNNLKIIDLSVWASIIYLCTLYFAIITLTGVAVFLPAAAMRELQSSIMTCLPNAYDCITQKSNSKSTHMAHSEKYRIRYSQFAVYCWNAARRATYTLGIEVQNARVDICSESN